MTRVVVRKDVLYQKINFMENKIFNSICSLDLVVINSLDPNCDPCKMRQPILEKVKGVLGNRITVINLESQDFIYISSKFRLESSTSLFVLANGIVVWETSSLLSKEELIKIILENT